MAMELAFWLLVGFLLAFIVPLLLYQAFADPDFQGDKDEW